MTSDKTYKIIRKKRVAEIKTIGTFRFDSQCNQQLTHDIQIKDTELKLVLGLLKSSEEIKIDFI